jgi:hypothetical protein
MMHHNGMRPQDIAVLLKIIISDSNWMSKAIAEDLFLSPSEISYSLQRSALAGLLDSSKRKVMRRTFLEFIQYGLPRVFPAMRGPIAIGIPTAFSSPVMSSYFMTNQLNEMVVWPYAEGAVRGETISPLYPNAVQAALKDQTLYELLSLADVMRMGKIREKEIALRLLEEKFSISHA